MSTTKRPLIWRPNSTNWRRSSSCCNRIRN
jgi:hypothetical protein